jgi:hypothetical protein
MFVMKNQFTIRLWKQNRKANWKFAVFIPCLILYAIGVQAQWIQSGSGIDGIEDFEYSGLSVSLSEDGRTVAIGAFNGAGGGISRGHVRVYKKTGCLWIQQGADIEGEADFDYSGWSVSLSARGTSVAIGAPYNAGGGSLRGHVRVFKLISGTWTQQGMDIDGEADEDYSGIAVSLSASGTIVAIGAYTNEGGGSNRGHVRVYKKTGNTWTQQGADIDGETDGDLSGESVALSSDGNIVAIGATSNAGGGYLRGHVRVYKSIGNTWTQQGADIDGEADLDFSGGSVSLSENGSVVAIGAPYSDGSGSYQGQVRVFKKIGNAWTQQGSDIDGEADGDNLGTSTSLSSNGNILAIGAPSNSGGGTYRGHVRVFKKINNTWTQLGADIDGQEDFENSGRSVSLSSDGAIVAIGAPYNSAGGSFRGQVRVYDDGSSEEDPGDNDCDGVENACDLCPGGDDMIDNNSDGLPDCHFLPAYADILEEWKCANNKVFIAHQGNDNCNTQCINYNNAQTHLNHGDYLGPCHDAECEQNYAKPPATLDADEGNTLLSEFKTNEQGDVFFTIQPNPVNDYLEIHFKPLSMDGRITVFNSYGGKLWEKEMGRGSDYIKINTSDMTDGRSTRLCFVTLHQDDHIIVRSFIVAE